MRIQYLAASLALASGVFGAQLTQVSNYGGSARAKPGMYVITIHLLHLANTIGKVGICARSSEERRAGRGNPLVSIIGPEVLPELPDSLEERLRHQRVRDSLAKLDHRVLGCVQQGFAVA